MLWSLFPLRKQFSTNSSKLITRAMLIKVHTTICIISQFDNLVKLHHVEGGREEGRSQHLGKPRSKRLVDFFHQRTTDNCHLHPQEGSKV
jgi:hypothetical protein